MTELEIANTALSWCGTNAVTALDEGSNTANVVKLLMPTVKDVVLAERDWSFAKDRLILSLDATVPAFGYAHRYVVPSTVVRVLRCYDAMNELMEDWAREGAYVVTDETAVYAEVTSRVDVGLWSGIAHQALTAKLASALAIPLTENRQLRMDLEALFKEFIKEAGASDGQQGRSLRLTVPRMAGRVR